MPRRLHCISGAALLLCLHLISWQARACSLISCINDGVETRPDFVVLVRHEGKPLKGVSVEISSFGSTPVLATTTDSSGRAGIGHLAPGQYWLKADLLGIVAAYHCFHVSRRPSLRAKRKMAYEWGDDAFGVQVVRGAITDYQYATGGTPLWNISHTVKVPIANAELRLQNPLTGTVLTSKSDDHGTFHFDSVAAGTYVLHIEGATTGRPYEPTNVLLRLSARARSSGLDLNRPVPELDGCGRLASLGAHWN